MQNATYLTEKYPGKEEGLWTPCLIKFFEEHPTLPISVPISNLNSDGHCYELRKVAPFLEINGTVLMDRGNDIFLSEIEKTFFKVLRNDEGRYLDNPKRDIAGINPDIMVIVPNKGVYLFENKPYDSISWTGNQGPDGAYVQFVNWLNNKGIHAEYIIIHSIGVGDKNDSVIMNIKKILGENYGSILLEDVFAKMDEIGFKYPLPFEDWKDFTDKGSDFLE
jgi:hypothetical protein